MAISEAQFLIRFPEFEGAPAGLIDEVIAEATRRVDPDQYLETTDDAIKYLAAHKLAISPYGQQARLSTDGSSTYKVEFDELRSEAAIGVRVI